MAIDCNPRGSTNAPSNHRPAENPTGPVHAPTVFNHMDQPTRHRPRIRAVVAVAAVLAAAACAEASDANPAPARVETATETTPSAAVDVGDSATSTEPASSTPLAPTSVNSAPVITSAPDVLVELDPADWTALERWRLPALGGVTFGVSEGSVVHHDGHEQMDRGRSLPTMILALITDNVGSGIEPTVDTITTAIQRYGTARPDGTRLEIFGLDLTGWEFALDDIGAATDQRQPLYLLPAMPLGARGETFWEPFPIVTDRSACVPFTSISATSCVSALPASRLPPRKERLTYFGRAVIGSRPAYARSSQ
jgi:hypothetical protein